MYSGVTDFLIATAGFCAVGVSVDTPPARPPSVACTLLIIAGSSETGTGLLLT